MANLSISISAETVFHVGPLAVTNSILTSIVVGVILISISIWSAIYIKATKKPKGLQNVLELLIEALESLTNNITESPKKTKTIFPYVLSFFLFIFLNNWIGLFPGVGTIGFVQKTNVPSAALQPEPSFSVVQIAHAQDIAPHPNTATATPDSTNLLSAALPTLISILVIVIAVNASKTTTASPSGLNNFLEAVVEITKGFIYHYNHSFLRKVVPAVVGIVLVTEVVYQVGLIPGFGPHVFHAPTKKTTTQPKITSVKQAPAEKVEAKTTPKNEFVPYLRAGTSDLNTTIALAIISVIATQVIGFQYLGLHYMQKYVNLKSPIDAFVGFLETISEFSHIISFAFRLFGNIFAGEVLLAVMYFLLPLLVPIPFIGLELFVGVIQAFVFAVLTLVFMTMATQGHEEAEKEFFA